MNAYCRDMKASDGYTNDDLDRESWCSSSMVFRIKGDLMTSTSVVLMQCSISHVVFRQRLQAIVHISSVRN
jgi:hypothetical protein